MSNYVVTGGSGFIGCNLVKRLTDEGHCVISVDNNYTGCMENVTWSNTTRFVHADVILTATFDEVRRQEFEDHRLKRIDGIFHLACPASPPAYQKDPMYTWKTGVIGTMNALDYAKRVGARFVQASTSEIYGDPQIKLQHERYYGNVNCFGLRSCYDESKRAGETACYEYSRMGVDVRVARIFNTYGPRMRLDDGRVVTNFVKQAVCGEPITVYGDGRQTRSFCYVDDTVDGLIRLMEHPEPLDLPINIGNPQEMTIADFAGLVCEKTGAKLRVKNCDLPSDDPMQRCPDITRAKMVLGWQPTTPIEVGLDRMIEYVRSIV